MFVTLTCFERVLTCRILSGQIDYLLCTQVHGRANKLIIAMGCGSIVKFNIKDRCFIIVGRFRETIENIPCGVK